jgi:hypothetical protein
MQKGPITIDPMKIEAKIAALSEEISGLRQLLELLERSKEFRVSEEHPVLFAGEDQQELPETSNRGRPRVHGVYDTLKKFIAGQSDDFSSADLRAAMGENAPKDAYHAAVRSLIKEGILTVIEQPIGRKIGVYRRGREPL